MAKLPRKSSISLIKELYQDPERKSLPHILTDIITLTFYNGRLPRHYFSRYLFKKGKTNIKDYFAGDILYKKFKPFLNDREVKDVVENKLFFNFFYGQFNIAVPVVYLYNHRKMFVYDGKSIEISNSHAFNELLENVFTANPMCEALFIKRTYGSYGGSKIFKLSRNQTGTDLIAGLYSEVIQAGFLFQEMIQQHPDLNVLNPSCLNTIRFDTFIDKNGNIDIISGYMRMSNSNSHVDNISSGGCMVGIDLESGKLKREGYSNISTHGVLVYYQHPITKVVFEGFKIPLFEEAKNLVKNAAKYMPGLRLVGWDVAIGLNGPVLVEGNSDYEISGNDLSDGGYRKNPVFRKVMQELNYTQWL